MIEVVKEPENLGEENQERCCFCCKATRYWSFQKDVPVCPDCSAEHDEDAVPTKEEYFELNSEDNGDKNEGKDGKGDNSAGC